jgi:predicted enzyme related to lactoylglutathione lyase
MSAAPYLPARPSLEQLRKLAKARLAGMRTTVPEARLTDAQRELAREYGFANWSALVSETSERRADARPRITRPVSRWLGARNIEHTVAFWQHVLGFSVDATASTDTRHVLVRDAARIEIGAHDSSPDFSGDAQAPGRAVVTLPVAGLDALHATITAAGGAPSAIEKINWLKLRTFHVQDPDGHVIWCCESYQRDMPPRLVRQCEKALPELPVDDVAAMVRHYCDVLGFSINYQQHDTAVLERDAVSVVLIARTPKHTGIGSLYCYVHDEDALHAELAEAGAAVAGAPVSQPWGLREFVVHDPAGNRISFGQPFE